eukprot:Rmarinus@m.29424
MGGGTQPKIHQFFRPASGATATSPATALSSHVTTIPAAPLTHEAALEYVDLPLKLDTHTPVYMKICASEVPRMLEFADEPPDDEGNMHFLVRECLVAMCRELVGPHSNHKKMLRGLGGAGKSTLLYQLVQHARASGWLVVYIPAAEQFSDKVLREAECVELMEQLAQKYSSELKEIPCKLPGYKNLWEFMHADDVPETKFSRLLQALMRNELRPVLVAIDRYNAIGDKCGDLSWLCQFSTISIRRGSFVVAVSASYERIQCLRDGDVMRDTLFIDVSPYDNEELDAVAKLYRCTRPAYKSVATDTIVELTGCVPRLVRFLAERDVDSFVIRAEEYYMGRVGNLWDRMDAADFVYVFRQYANLPIKTEHITPRWRESGLIAPSGHFVCPAALNSLCGYVQTSEGIDRAMHIMLDLETTRGYAFELLVLRSLRTFGWKLTIPGCSNVNNLDLSVDYVVRQKQGPVDLQDKLRPGTLLQCYDGHPAVDAVIFTRKMQVVFVQISITAYSGHHTKLPQLLEKTVRLQDNTDRLMFHAYCELCGLNAGRNRKKLPNHVYYLYITLSSVTPRKKTGENFLHVGPKELYSLADPKLTSLLDSAYKS